MAGRAENSRAFASDNWAGAHPEVLAALAAVNAGHVSAYGRDHHTLDAIARITAEVGDAEVFFVFSGTAANVLCLQSMVRAHQAVICADTAHIHTSECGASEKQIGCKLLPIAAPSGKIMVPGIESHMHHLGNEHHVQPRAISITQATEYGTVYTVREIKAISDFAHTHNLLLHMDGARLYNAAASLGVPLHAITKDAGVDALSLGGTKNGLMAGEAVVFFNERLADDFEFRRMQGMQLSSKMRFIAAQFSALFANGLWKKSATHANRMAKLLGEQLAAIPEVKLTQPVEANAVFATMPPRIVASLQESYYFHVWNEASSEARLITSFDTTEADVMEFTALARDAQSHKKGDKLWI
ncbi:MAG TPA: beta-eliminating lyase-related protein [Gemmatimonadaceae bacterium]|nr:beta-eliminating lyase-related protein [Gemmatimonadaceae bacterium]